MNKTELIDAVAKETGFKKKDAEAAVAATIAAIENALVAGEHMESQCSVMRKKIRKRKRQPQ